MIETHALRDYVGTYGSHIGKSVPFGDLIGDIISVAVLELHQESVRENLFGPGHLSAAGHHH